MARVRRIHKTKRLLLTKYRSVGTFNDGCPKLEIYFSSSNGSNYVWTPEWRGETLRLFQHACQLKAVNQPSIEVEQACRKPVPDYISLAIKAAKALNEKTTLDRINKVAKALFRFDTTSHMDKSMPDVVSQEIYDWIMTLSEQPFDEEEKWRLAQKFIVSLAPVSSPVEKPETSYAGE